MAELLRTTWLDHAYMENEVEPGFWRNRVLFWHRSPKWISIMQRCEEHAMREENIMLAAMTGRDTRPFEGGGGLI